jgi:hypothetical protein
MFVRWKILQFVHIIFEDTYHLREQIVALEN